jgi:hypothetical protein
MSQLDFKSRIKFINEIYYHAMFKMNGLNAIALCGNKILMLQSRSEFQILEDETMKHRVEFQRVYPDKQSKSLGR